MKTISDLTKDTRMSLEEILRKSIHDIVESDMEKSNDDSAMVEYENHTFYYRVILVFMKDAIDYYSDKEIEEWCRVELLKEVILPELEDYRKRASQV